MLKAELIHPSVGTLLKSQISNLKSVDTKDIAADNCVLDGVVSYILQSRRSQQW
jgi:hypothetical protein